MTTTHQLTFMAVTLLLGGGMLQSASAQDTQPAALGDSPTGYQEPASTAGEWAISPRSHPSTGPEAMAAPSSSQDADTGPLSLHPENLVPIVSDQGIRYVSGGVGDDERAELDALSNQYNLRLLFAMQGSGEYLAAVRVNILDVHGVTVLAAESRGPWFFTQLPAGDYIVDVSTPGQGLQEPQRQTAHIGGSGQSRLDFRWN
jgi:hypothetical protein